MLMPYQIYWNSAVVTSFCKFHVAHENSRKSISFMGKLREFSFSPVFSTFLTFIEKSSLYRNLLAAISAQINALFFGKTLRIIIGFNP